MWRNRFPRWLERRRRRRSYPAATALLVQIPDDLVEPLDAWIQTQPAGALVSRPEAVRFALRDWLIGQGVLSSPADEDDQEVLRGPE